MRGVGGDYFTVFGMQRNRDDGTMAAGNADSHHHRFGCAG